MTTAAATIPSKLFLHHTLQQRCLHQSFLIQIVLQANTMRLSGSGVYQRTPVPKMPPGLVEMLEGLTRDVLKHNPPDIYEFCAKHMQTLLEIRDGPTRMQRIPLNKKIKTAQEVVRKRQSWLSKDDINSPTSYNITNHEILNTVHHDNDLTNCSEIEISLQPGDMVNDEKIDHVKVADTKEDPDLKKPEPFDNLSLTKDVNIHSDYIENTNDKDTNLSNSVNCKNNLRDIEVESPRVNEIFDLTESIYCKDQTEFIDNTEPKMEKLVVENIMENDKIKTTDLDTEFAKKTEEIVDSKKTQNNNDVKDAADQSSQNNVQKNIEVLDANINDEIKFSDNDATTEAENHKHEPKNESRDIHDHLSVNGVVHETQEKQDMTTNSNISLSIPDITIDDENQEHAMKMNIEDNKTIENNTLEIQNKDTSIINISETDQNTSRLSHEENKEDCPDLNKSVEIKEYNIPSDIRTETKKESLDHENKSGTLFHEEENVALKLGQQNEDKEDKLRILKKDTEHQNGDSIVALKSSQSNEYGKDMPKNTEEHLELKHEYKVEEPEDIEVGSEVIEDVKLDQQSNINLHSNFDVLQKKHESAVTIMVNRELTGISSKKTAEECESNISDNVAREECKILDEHFPTEISGTTNADLEQTILSKQDSKQLVDGKNLDSVQENKIQRMDNIKSDDCGIGASDVETAIESSETDNSTNDNVNNMDLETAAVTIQKVFRTFLFKSRASTFDDSTNDDNNLSDDDNDKDNETRSFLTSSNKDRRALGISRMDTVLQTVNEEKSLSLSTDDSSTLSSAATIIQAHVRGFLVRNKLNSGKTASSTNSLINSDVPSSTSLDGDGDQHKNKTILNIHIVPEGNNFLSRDESMITSMDLSLDGSPPSSINLHPLGYDISERRKQLKREDAIQSVSPPSNNSGKLSDDVESVKDLPNSGSLANVLLEQDTAAAFLSKESNINNSGSLKAENDTKPVKLSEGIETENTLSNDENHTFMEQATPASLKIANEITEFINQESNIESKTTESSNTNKMESEIETHNRVASSPEPVKEASDKPKKTLTKQSSDETDVVTPYKGNTPRDSDTSSRLLHSGEFHDSVLPTKVSRSDTPVASGE